MLNDTDIFFNEIYDAEYTKVLRYIVCKVGDLNDVKEIVQDVFAEFYAVTVRKGIDYIKNPQALLIKIAKSKLFRFYTVFERISNRISYEKEEEGEIAEIEDIDIDDKLNNRIIIEEVFKIIKKKPLAVQKLFYMYYYLDMTLKDISCDTGLSESDVKHKIYRTLDEVRKYLKDGDA